MLGNLGYKVIIVQNMLSGLHETCKNNIKEAHWEFLDVVETLVCKLHVLCILVQVSLT